MLKKKQIVVALTSALLCLGIGASFAAVQTGGAGSGSTVTGNKSSETRITTGENSTACKEAKARVAKDKKDDDDRQKSKDDGKTTSLKHHNSKGEDSSKKHDDDKQAKNKAHTDEMTAACAAVVVKAKDEKTKTKEAEDKKAKDKKDSDDKAAKDKKDKENNGYGNGDQNAPGGSAGNNCGENRTSKCNN